MTEPKEGPQPQFAPMRAPIIDTIYVNGRRVAQHIPVVEPRRLRAERFKDRLDARVFSAPKLKVERAKRHIQELHSAIQAFHGESPYEPTQELDPKTGENVYRVRVHKSIPIEFATIIGDVVHNLRSALDQLVCCLVVANGHQVRRGTGFPISGAVKHFESDAIGKVRGISARAKRLLRRLKPYKGGNSALWLLHELDVLDKHKGIIPVAAGHARTAVRFTIPMLGMGPKGELTIGGVPDGGMPFQTLFGVPENAKVVCPLTDNAEIYRSTETGLHEELQISIEVAFGKTQATQGEPVLNTLNQIAIFVERALSIFERRCL